VGTDRRGPLAAFIVVAIIAVILLVTSVRSQAAPGWLDRQLPASVVAIVPSTTDDGLLAAIGDGMGQLVAHGTVLVHKATADHSSADDTPSPAPASVPERGGSSSSHRHASSTHPTTQGAGTQPGSHPDSQPAHVTGTRHADPADGSDSDTDVEGDHGRHLGWDHGHHPPGHAPGHGRHLGWTRQLPGDGA
jgi:hypothetical protein